MTDTITVAQLKEMFELQDEMNKKVHPEWKIQGYDWSLAAQKELMEGVDHLGWKWWKKQEPDLPQAQLEVVDAWHFWMSDMLSKGLVNFTEIEEDLNNNIYEDHSKGFFQTHACYYGDLLEGHSHQWGALLKCVELTPHKLYEMYIQKNVLNHFRQDNGYKEGTYIKEWFGVEDNVQLLLLSEQLKDSGDFNRENLYLALEQMYSLVN